MRRRREMPSLSPSRWIIKADEMTSVHFSCVCSFLVKQNVVVTGLSLLICMFTLYFTFVWLRHLKSCYSPLHVIISGSRNERIFTAIFPVYFEIIYKTLLETLTNACVIGLFSSSCPLAWPLGCSKSITKHWIDLYASSNCQMILVNNLHKTA